MIWLVAGAALTAAAAVWWWRLWPKLLFSPRLHEERDAFHRRPEHFRPFEEIRDRNVVLEGIVYEPDESDCTLLYFGGKEQDSVALVGKLSDLFPSFRIVSFNYRGYGRSGGNPSEKALLEDAVFLTKKTVRRYGRVFVAGYSLGASVAAFAASREEEVGGLILVAPFYSVPALVRARRVPVPDALVRFRFETARYLGGVKAPVWIFASKDDTLVPAEQSRALKERAHTLVDYKEYSGYNHAEILWSPEFSRDMKEVCRWQKTR